MDALLDSTMPWLAVALLPLTLLLLTPLLRQKARKIVAMVFAGGVVSALVSAALLGSDERTLAVVNVYPSGPDGTDMQVHTLHEVTQPSYVWPLTLAAFLALALVLTFTARGSRGDKKPGLIVNPLLATTWLLALRLALEYGAAPDGLVWACGVSVGMPLVLLFQGIYAGRANLSFGRMLGQLALFAILQRGLLAGVSWWLTTQQQGTHLDVSTLPGFHSALLGEYDFEGAEPVDRWLPAIAIAQAMWALGHVVLGIVFAGVGRMLARSRKR